MTVVAQTPLVFDDDGGRRASRRGAASRIFFRGVPFCFVFLDTVQHSGRSVVC